MPCTITLADLGTTFADTDTGDFDLWLATATEIVLGPTECQSDTEDRWRNCCVDPCTAIKLLVQHLIAMDPGSDIGGSITSERVGDVAVAYANASSSAGMFGGSPYGLAYSSMLAKFQLCGARRNTLPIAFVGGGGCGC